MNFRRLLAAGAIALAAFFILKSRMPLPHPGDSPLSDTSSSGISPATPQTSNVPTQSSPHVMRTLSPEGQKQIQIMHELFRSRNDNDPRMDTELRHLSADVRDELRDEYRRMRRESLNERGTIVFLLGRNLETPADVNFLREVLEEAPCQSLADCSKDSPALNGQEIHQESGMDITRAYPQLVALQSVDRLLSDPTGLDPVRKESALQVVQAGVNSKDGTVARQAARLAQKYAR